MTTEEMEFLNSVRKDVHNLGASFNELLAAIGPLVAVIQRQEAKIDSNAAAVGLMLGEQGKNTEATNEILTVAQEHYAYGVSSHDSLIRSLDAIVGNQHTDHGSLKTIWEGMNATDKKIDASFKSVLSKIGSPDATLDNQWANRQ